MPPPGTFANLGNATLQAATPAGWPAESGGPFANWGGGVFASNFSTLGAYVVYGSGHLTPGSPLFSGVWCFDLDDLTWKGRNVPSMPVVEGGSFNGFGESTTPGVLGHPYPPHTYNGLIYQPASAAGGPRGSLIQCCSAGSAIASPTRVHRFDLSSSTNPPTRVVDALGGDSYPCAATDVGRGGFWFLSGNGNGPLKFVKFADWSQTVYPGVEYNQYGNQRLVHLPAPWDCLVGMGSADTNGVNFSVYVCPLVQGVPQGFQRVMPTGTPPSDGRCGGQWSTLLNCIVSYEAAGSTRVHRLQPPAPAALLTGTWTWTSEQLTGRDGATPSRGANNGAWSRFIEVPAARCFIWCDSVTSAVQAWRLSGM